jgi:hypothetical protein
MSAFEYLKCGRIQTSLSGNFEIGRILDLKFETRNLRMDWEKENSPGIFREDAEPEWFVPFPVHSQISSFEFEMQDSSNFEFPT